MLVCTALLALFGQWTVDLTPRWQMQAGLRAERHRFEAEGKAEDGVVPSDVLERTRVENPGDAAATTAELQENARPNGSRQVDVLRN